MFESDHASKSLGMNLIEIGNGHATITMEVRPDMVNGLGVCHGGLIFSLADSAMAFATNARNQYALATSAEIDWVSPGLLGTVLTANVVERHRQGKNTICDAVVTDSDGNVVAYFRGRTRTVRGQHIDEESN